MIKKKNNEFDLTESRLHYKRGGAIGEEPVNQMAPLLNKHFGETSVEFGLLNCEITTLSNSTEYLGILACFLHSVELNRTTERKSPKRALYPTPSLSTTDPQKQWPHCHQETRTRKDKFCTTVNVSFDITLKGSEVRDTFKPPLDIG